MDKQLLKDYLESWLDNVGRSSTDEETLAEALSDRESLVSWGLTQGKWEYFEYDYDYAMSIIKGELNE